MSGDLINEAEHRLVELSKWFNDNRIPFCAAFMSGKDGAKLSMREIVDGCDYEFRSMTVGTDNCIEAIGKHIVSKAYTDEHVTAVYESTDIDDLIKSEPDGRPN